MSLIWGFIFSPYIGEEILRYNDPIANYVFINAYIINITNRCNFYTFDTTQIEEKIKNRRWS